MGEHEQALTFAILMESNTGILGKSPEYVLEKWRVAQKHEDPKQLLDSDNRAKIWMWFTKWMRSSTPDK